MSSLTTGKAGPIISLTDKFCKEIEAETIAQATEALLLIDKNGIDLKSFSAGHFPNHLNKIKEGQFNPNNKKGK